MPCFETIIQNNQLLCGCVVAVHSDSNEKPEELRQYTALIDTGATGCCISNRIVKDFSLDSNQTMPTIGVHGKNESKVYRIDIGLFTTTKIDLLGDTGGAKTEHRMDVKLASGVLVTEFDNSHQNFDAIIGMQYLNACTLIVSKQKFTICY